MELFKKILTTCFDIILKGPFNAIMKEVNKWWVAQVGKIWLEYINMLYYDVTVSILHFLDATERFQRAMLGIENIVVTDNGRVDLLSSLMTYGKFNSLLLQFVFISFLLTALFATRRLLSDIAKDNNDKQPMITYFKNLVKCWGRLVSTFLYCICILNFVCLGSLTIATVTGCARPNMSNIIFVMGAQDKVRDVANKQKVLNKYIDVNDTAHTYSKSASIARDFYKSDINFLLILIVAGALLVVMIKVTIQLSRRLISLVILYLVGPFFAAMSLLDGKEKAYEDWKGMFLANFIQGMIVLVAYFAFTVIAKEIATTNIIRVSSNQTVNSVVGMIFILCIALGIPSSFRFGYNLLTDKGRFLDNDIPKLSDIYSLTR